MKTKIIFFIFFVLFATSVYSAQPINPTTQTSSSGTLEILYPQALYFQQGAVVELDFHVFNSTGSILGNNKINCSIHMYNYSGYHIISQNLSYSASDKDFELVLNSSITSEHRDIPYIVWCFDSGEFGYLSSRLFIGVHEDIYESKEVYVPVAYLLILVIFIYLFVGITWKLEEKTSIVKLFLYLYVVWLVPLIVELMNRMALVSQFSTQKVTLIQALYTTTMWVNITFTFIVGIFLFYNLLKLFGVDIVKSFRRGGR